MQRILAVALILGVLGACTATVRTKTPTIETPNVTVKLDDGPRHCPPGHAKKGWC